MTSFEVKGVHRVRAKGRTYVYAWRGGPRIKGEEGSKEFLAQLADLTRAAPDPGKMAGLVAEYRATDAFLNKAASTRVQWGPWLDRIRDDLGSLSVKTFGNPEVRKIIKKWRARWKDTPRTADYGKQVLSAVLSYAVEDGRIGLNPCFGIANLYSADRADIIWTAEDLARMAAVASPEIMFALRLACLTGARQGDLLKLTWADVGDLSIERSTGKSRGRRELVVPLYGELRALLAEIRAYYAGRGVHPMTLLATSRGTPWAGFGSSWNHAITMAGLDLHFHDARGTAATKFHMAGFADEEIAEILAWDKDKVERIINRYVRRGARLRAKIARLDEAAG